MKESVRHRIANLIIADYVHSGRLKVGEKLPTVRELKDIYGTSDTTIQHALNILELWGIVKKRHGSGSFIAETGNVQNGMKSKIIGCISSFGDNDIAIHIYEGIERVCRRTGYHMVVANTRDDYAAEQEQVKRMVEMGCQAIVLYPVPRTAEQLRSDYLKSSYKDTPIILIDNAYPEQGRSQVVFDNYQAGHDMTELLIKEGHKRIAFMMQDSNLLVKSVQDRHSGFLDALSEYGIPFNEDDLWVLSASKSVYSSAQEDIVNNITPELINLRDNENSPTAAIAVEDTTAIYTINVAQELGIIVPDQLRVVGFDNLGIARLFKPSFPTTEPNFTRAGTIAAEMAIDQAMGGDSSVSSVYIQKLSVPVKRRRVTSSD